MMSVSARIRNWLKAIVFPVQEVTVYFLMLGPEEWMAYVEEMPAVNSAAQALGGLLRELKQYDAGARTITRITHYRYLRTRLLFVPY
jgi:hypothetical protein